MRTALGWFAAVLVGAAVAWVVLALLMQYFLYPFIRLAYLLGG